MARERGGIPTETLMGLRRRLATLPRRDPGRRAEGLCCKPDVGVSEVRTTAMLASCLCAGQTVL